MLVSGFILLYVLLKIGVGLDFGWVLFGVFLIFFFKFLIFVLKLDFVGDIGSI